MNNIYTIGYEGLDIERFISLLRSNGVETVVDVRELPLSRKRGFSKNSLRDVLNLNGFEYIHMVKLGCPKSVRNQYKEDGNWGKYKTGFLKHLKAQQETVEELAEVAASSPCALLCFEADFNVCHRSMVAEAVQNINGMAVSHLQPATVKTSRAATLSLGLA